MKAPAEIPHGGKPVRVVRVETQPKATPIQNCSKVGDAAAAICPPTKVDLSLFQRPDKAERVVASSPNGTITRGLNIPVALVPKVPRVQRWSVSALRGYDVARGKSAWGAGLSYTRGPFVGTTGAIGSTAFLGIGLKLQGSSRLLVKCRYFNISNDVGRVKGLGGSLR